MRTKAEKTRIVKAALKKEFPKVKFSVSPSIYYTAICWNYGPSPETVLECLGSAKFDQTKGHFNSEWSLVQFVHENVWMKMIEYSFENGLIQPESDTQQARITAFYEATKSGSHDFFVYNKPDDVPIQVTGGTMKDGRLTLDVSLA